MPPVLIITHGQPSDPAPSAQELARLAMRVAHLLPNRQIGSVTLAEPGGLAREVARLGTGGLAYPLFMAGGWFTRLHLPARLQEAGAVGWQVLEPMGCDPAVHQLAIAIVKEAIAKTTVPPAEMTLVLAAHGSFRSSVPSDIARHLVAKIMAATGLGRAEAAFIDQSPRIADLPPLGVNSLCLPFFASAGGHVIEDIPNALQAARFTGRLLPALGLDRRIPGVIAQAIDAEQSVCATECRYRV